MTRTVTATEKLSSRIFKAVHGRNLIYNTCWEDPALDRIALDFRADDEVLVITSAGCNALDYLLTGVARVNAVDMNPRQNALLELKVAGIRGLSHAEFFELFGDGRSPRINDMYHDAMRRHLSPMAQKYWDKHLSFFRGRGWRSSFYFRGTSGLFAKVMLQNAQIFQRLRRPIEALLAATTIDQQRDIYVNQIQHKLWTRSVKWFLSRHLTLSLVGVPWPQRNEILTQYPGGVASFIRGALEAVVLELPLSENYFWRVYMQGHYTRECCPEYLKPENFARLKNGLVDRLAIHTNSVTGFLRETDRPISKFTLLDHMDWMSWHLPEALIEEWNAILEKATPGARVIYRSAGLKVSYLDHLTVNHQGRAVELGSLLKYEPDLAAKLHARDRVHTYGSFYIARLP